MEVTMPSWFSTVIKVLSVVGGITASVVAASPGGPAAMIAAGTAAATAAAGGLHMQPPKYSSAKQKPGQDTEDPR
jgi:hypothetical protein